jgi:hypothetical protein
MMGPWGERPTEVANLLNPAFAGALLRLALDGYAREARAGLPFELAFLVLPICLHPGTTSRLPVSPTTTPIHAWLQRDANRDVLVSFPERLRSLLPFTREAILYAAQRGVISVDDAGLLRAGPKKLRGITAYRKSGGEVSEAIRRAEFTGRWFALSGTTSTIFTLFGVRP